MTETTLSKKKRAFDSKLQSPTLFSPHVAAYPPGRVHRAAPRQLGLPVRRRCASRTGQDRARPLRRSPRRRPLTVQKRCLSSGPPAVVACAAANSTRVIVGRGGLKRRGPVRGSRGAVILSRL